MDDGLFTMLKTIDNKIDYKDDNENENVVDINSM